MNKTISKENYDAVLFDLDGVVTDTAALHADCWKQMFDEFLLSWSQENGAEFLAFDIGSDYKRCCDGKPRYDGVKSFLDSRDIQIPYGSPNDAEETLSICGLGNRKNALVNTAIESSGVEVYASSVSLINQLISSGIKIAVVSSSKNCQTVLRAVGIEELFEVRIDGIVATELNLPGKPAPNTFLEAAKQLGTTASRAVVVEDAISGVQAGRDGQFGLVVGVARHGEQEALKANGAHIVVEDLGELLS